jgi:hypothetical protein
LPPTIRALFLVDAYEVCFGLDFPLTLPLLLDLSRKNLLDPCSTGSRARFRSDGELLFFELSNFC